MEEISHIDWANTLRRILHRQTKQLNKLLGVMFFLQEVTVENLDDSENLSDVKIIATLGGWFFIAAINDEAVCSRKTSIIHHSFRFLQKGMLRKRLLVLNLLTKSPDIEAGFFYAVVIFH